MRAVAAWAQHDGGASLDAAAHARLLDPLVALLGEGSDNGASASGQALPVAVEEALVQLALVGSEDAFCKPLNHKVSPMLARGRAGLQRLVRLRGGMAAGGLSAHVPSAGQAAIGFHVHMHISCCLGHVSAARAGHSCVLALGTASPPSAAHA